ncbi:pyrroline-5-carboxylate reductase [bacterium]
MNKKICFLGSGNMTEALMRVLIDKEIFSRDNICCVDINKDRLSFLENFYRINICLNNNGELENKNLVESSDIFVLAVKPNTAKEILDQIKDLITDDKLVISIMAGITIDKIQIYLQKAVQIVRVMPNTPVLVGAGAVGYCFNNLISDENKDIARDILSGVGLAKEVDEADLDSVTALSGSGPAYVFYLAEAMIEAGIELGLSSEISRELTIETLYGASLMLKETDLDPLQLRKNVTSKGGTTQAATEYFDKNNLKTIIKSALNKAKARSIELSK